MNAVGFAARALIRQPARASLGIAGVAAVGALLFDMLLLSQGLIVSMRDLLDRLGWDLRVTMGDELPGRGSRLPDASRLVDAIAALPSVSAVTAVRFADASLDVPAGVSPAGDVGVFFNGVSARSPKPWTLLQGQDADGDTAIVINQALASLTGRGVGDPLTLRASCTSRAQSLPPVRFRISGIVEWPFEEPRVGTVSGTFAALRRACAGELDDYANLLLVSAAADPLATTAAIRRARPELAVLTNEEMIGRVERTGFTYFRQISTVLTTVTVAFAVLLISVLLTVSVNQRLGETAALRALGFSRRRVVADVMAESALIVGAGGVLSLPLGLALASGLDRILKQMPGIPEHLHFFVFQPGALVVHVALLAATALIAALYPMRIVSRLPIAATLRDEVAG